MAIGEPWSTEFCKTLCDNMFEQICTIKILNSCPKDLKILTNNLWEMWHRGGNKNNVNSYHEKTEDRSYCECVHQRWNIFPLTFLYVFCLLFPIKNGAISVPETVRDDGEGSEGTPSDDVESAAPIDAQKGAVRFGWIRGVLVSVAPEVPC